MSSTRVHGRKPPRGSRAVEAQLGSQRLASLWNTEPLATKPVIQTQLEISEPNDKFEQEADRVAEHVMRSAEPGSGISDVSPENRRGCAGCSSGHGVCSQCTGQERTIQRKQITPRTASGASPYAGGGLTSEVSKIKGGGQPLPESVRAFFEPRFGYDFRQVRIHTQPNENSLSRALSARAFTVGSDVVFAAGQFSPGTTNGKKLIAHELAHVVQQGSGTATSNAAQQSGQSPATIQRFSESDTRIEERFDPASGSGQPLAEPVRAFFESRFGYDFSQVQVHSDARAAESARAVNALAFTRGQDIVFVAGNYAPQTKEGKRLLAHELTHVIQQGSDSVPAHRLQRQKEPEEKAVIKGAVGESPVPASAYVHEQGCDVASASNLIADPAVQKGMLEALTIMVKEGNVHELSYHILQHKDCHPEVIFANSGIPATGAVSYKPLPDGRVKGLLKVGDIHTHPPLRGYIPGPSLVDQSNMRSDPKSFGNEAYIIDPYHIYVIFRNGDWRTLGPTADVLGLSDAVVSKLRLKRTPEIESPGLGELTTCVRKIGFRGLKQVLGGEQVAVLMASFAGCSPCDLLQKEMEPLCEQFTSTLFFRADFIKEPELEQIYGGISSYPTIIILRGTTVKERFDFSGGPAFQVAQIRAALERVLKGESEPVEPKPRFWFLELGSPELKKGFSMRGGARLPVASRFEDRLRFNLDIAGTVAVRDKIGTTLTLEPRLGAVFNPGDPKRNWFVETSVGAGLLLSEEEARRLIVSIGAGTGYAFVGEEGTRAEFGLFGAVQVDPFETTFNQWTITLGYRRQFGKR